MSVAAHCPAWCLRFFLVALCLSSSTACNRTGCDEADYTVKTGAPVITNMEYLYALPHDPWTLIFAIDFTDTAGAVGNGNALFYLNGNNTPTVLALPDYFESSDVPLDATSGRFAVHLRFASDGVQDGTVVRLGTQLENSASTTLKSNCFSLDLLFNVSAWPQSLQQGVSETRRLATRAWGLLKSAS